MQLTELLHALRLEYHDADTPPQLEDEQLQRTVSQALVALKKDVKQVYTLNGEGVISPALDPEDRELLVAYALVVICRMMQAKTARGFSFSSGDKRIDKTRQPAYWAELGRGYLDQYRQGVAERNPEYGLGVPAVTPMLYGGDVQ